MKLPAPPILVITDRTQCSEPLETRADALFRGGCRWLSLREKDLTANERMEILTRLIALAGRYGAIVGVHGDREAAMAHRCALHLPAGDDTASARRALGQAALIGQSCHNPAELEKARAGGTDYATLSPVFASAGKPGYAPLEMNSFAAAARSTSIPVLALGGVDDATLPYLKGMGAGGIAVMGAAMRTSEPEGWFRRFASRWAALQAAESSP